jgi:imidazolonepropionase-like amidohydrolase
VEILAVLVVVVDDAIEAGFDSFEHGSLLAPERLDALARAGAAWVPTLVIYDDIAHMVEGTTSMREIKRGLERIPDALQRAAESGVTLLAGTDAGLSDHGEIVREIEMMASLGVPREIALGAGSWRAREWLGLPGITEGAPADLLAFRDDPRDDLGRLRQPALAMFRGRVLGGAPDPSRDGTLESLDHRSASGIR